MGLTLSADVTYMKWISIKEETPNNSRHVLVTDGYMVGITSFHKRTNQWRPNMINLDTGNLSDWINTHDIYDDHGMECLSEDISHWMNLPELPE